LPCLEWLSFGQSDQNVFPQPAKDPGPTGKLRHARDGRRIRYGILQSALGATRWPEWPSDLRVDVQQKMLDALLRRARRANVVDRIETRVCETDNLRVADLVGQIDFVLAFAVVHEVSNAARFFSEVHSILKPHGRILFAEPKGHVSERAFRETLSIAEHNGLQKVDSLRIVGSLSVVLERG
jgi:SAM-dependent methyltransferase